MIFKNLRYRKLWAVLLSAALAFTTAIPVFAAEEVPVQNATQVQIRASSVGRSAPGAAAAREADVPEFTIQDTLLLRQTLLSNAASHLGKPYVFGGTGPNGFDCSGFVRYVYGQTGYSLTRTCSTQMQEGEPVEEGKLQPGDILFFRDPGSSSVSTHVGIYIGNRQMIHAGSRGIGYADLDLSYWTVRYIGARRIIPVGTLPTETAIPTLGLR